MQTNMSQIALIGFGEAGSTMAATGGYTGARVFDIKLADPDPAIAAAMQARIEEAGLIACATPTEAVTGAEILLCVVTADQAAKAAALAARHLAPGALWLDMNSCCLLYTSPSPRDRG